MATNATVNRFGIGLLHLLVCLLCAANAQVAWSETADAAGTTLANTTATALATDVSTEIARTEEACRQNLMRLRSEVVATQQMGTPVPRLIVAEMELWGRLELLMLQRKTVMEDRSTHGNELASIESQEAEQAPPGSFLEVDGLRDRLESEKQKLHSLRLEWQAEKRIVLAAKGKFDDAEQQRRRSDERYDRSDPSERPSRNRERLLARLQSRVMSAELEFHREQSELMGLRVDTLQARVSYLEGIVESYRFRFTLTRDELEQRLKLIEKMELQVRQQLSEVNSRLRSSMQYRDVESSTSAVTSYEIDREESQLFQRLLSEIGEIKECWRRRYLLSNDQVSANQVAVWREESEQTKQRVAQIVEQLEYRTQQRRESLSQLNRATLTGQNSATGEDERDQASELRRIIDTYGNVQILAAAGERLCQRLIEDLTSKEDRFSLSEYVQLAKGSLRSVWDFELTTIDDEAITVRKIVFGLILLLCGYYVSRMLASVLAYRVSPKLGVTPAGAAVLRTVLFYLLVTAFAFASLEIVNVPLTIFAFLGGAVAIGLGFGSQNLINNFISGLILLVERPIRIGDLVNVDGIDANVDHIGARSTRVRTGANLEILVPNSKFLENNVTNWTLSDTRTRTSVSVGVAYGSPVRRVRDILSQVIREHEMTLPSPEPIVLFTDFADSSLAFEVHFWINMKRMMDAAKICSDVRMAIDDAFREAGIVIAFPQQDVHLDMTNPIQVMLSEPAQQGSVRLRAA